MRLFVDRETRETTARTAGAAIDEAAAAARACGRLIVDVIVDGTPWGDAEIASPSHRAQPAGEVRVGTMERAALVLDAIDEAETALAEAGVLQQEAADLLQRDDGAAWERLREALDRWSAVHAAAGAAEEALPVVPGGEGGVEEALPQLRARLVTIRDALLARDPVGLADALLYEMPDTVAAWRRRFSALRRRVSGVPPTGKSSSPPGAGKKAH